MSMSVMELIEAVMRDGEEERASRDRDPLDDAVGLDALEAQEDPSPRTDEGIYEDGDNRLYEEFGYLQRYTRVSTGRRKLVPPSAG